MQDTTIFFDGLPYPYTKVYNPYLPQIDPDLVRISFHPLIKVTLFKNNNLIKTEAYIDTGSQWCLFNNEFASYLGIKDYKNTKDKIPLSGVGGKQPKNIAYFYDLTLIIFKDTKNLKLKNVWKLETKIGFLEKPIGFSAILGVYGFLDHFTFKCNIPEGYFEIEPIFEV
jgi:hypothetical protein